MGVIKVECGSTLFTRSAVKKISSVAILAVLTLFTWEHSAISHIFLLNAPLNGFEDIIIIIRCCLFKPIFQWCVNQYRYVNNRPIFSLQKLSWSSRHVVSVHHVCCCLTRSGQSADDISCWHGASLSIEDNTCKTTPHMPYRKMRFH